MPMSYPTVCEELAAKSYDELTANFDWSIAERELGYKPGEAINIGWMCSDRICHLGMADKVALYWEDYQGNQQQFTFDDLRVLSNTVAQFVCDLGIQPGERVCLFMDRVPELSLEFLGIRKTGAVAQPLFSAFAMNRCSSGCKTPTPQPSLRKGNICTKCARSASSFRTCGTSSLWMPATLRCNRAKCRSTS